ncbi:MAG: GNAT family N-acetyltransferase [Terrimesophilobacter sp.]
MELRRATAEEWAASREIRLRALTEAPHTFCSTLERELAFDDQQWRDRLAQAATFLAWDHDSPVGTATGKVDPHEEGSRELVAMWVDPTYRRFGIAVALINSVAEWARTDGARAIALWVAEDNEPARSLYDKCGFGLTGEREDMRLGIDQLRMRKVLDG